MFKDTSYFKRTFQDGRMLSVCCQNSCDCLFGDKLRLRIVQTWQFSGSISYYYCMICQSQKLVLVNLHSLFWLKLDCGKRHCCRHDLTVQYVPKHMCGLECGIVCDKFGDNGVIFVNFSVKNIKVISYFLEISQISAIFHQILLDKL